MEPLKKKKPWELPEAPADFKPTTPLKDVPITETIKNPKGYTFKTGGETFDLTEEEKRWIDFKESKDPSFLKGGETPTPQAKRVVEIIEFEREKRKQDQLLRSGALSTRARDELLKSRYTELSREDIEKEIKDTPVSEDVQELPEYIDINKTMGEQIPLIKRDVAEIIDKLRVGITGKKPLNIQKAEQSFNDAAQILSDDLKLVELGLKDYSEVYGNIKRAESAIARLERENKGISRENVRYWADDGAELATQIEMEKSRINTFKERLVIAANAQRMAEAAVGYK
jgi:hypothetical protein